MRSNPNFKDLPRDYKKNLTASYSYNYKLNTKEHEVKISKPDVPNQLLAGLFRNYEVDTKLGNYLASILERFAEKKSLA